MKKIYHGTHNPYMTPVYGGGNQYNDYGPAFYTTTDFVAGCMWAVSESSDGFLYEYECDMKGLNICNLHSPNYSTANWIALLLKYRDIRLTLPRAFSNKEYFVNRFAIDISDYDAIVGYRADDRFFWYTRSFLAGTHSYQEMLYAMISGMFGDQLAFRSKYAISRLIQINKREVKSSEWYIPKMHKEEHVFKSVRNYTRIPKNSDLYLIDIIRNKISHEEIIAADEAFGRVHGFDFHKSHLMNQIIAEQNDSDGNDTSPK